MCSTPWVRASVNPSINARYSATLWVAGPIAFEIRSTVTSRRVRRSAPIAACVNGSPGRRCRLPPSVLRRWYPCFVAAVGPVIGADPGGLVGGLGHHRGHQRPDLRSSFDTKVPWCGDFVYGSDGTRTRDLRRDRPAF